MKRVYAFLKSMKFGIILLSLLALVSIAGSLIPQNEPAMTYVREYPSSYQLIFSLQLNRVFSSWYYLLITALLCLNLILCSIIRFQSISALSRREALSHVRMNHAGTPEEMETLASYFEKEKFRRSDFGDTSVYSRHEFGLWGTFLTHLGILFTVIFFALGMALPSVSDLVCMPGESVFLEDGTEIFVQSFSINDEEGKLDYRSIVNVILPGGKESGLSPVSVNHPLLIGDISIFQQTYGTRGHITVTDQNGHQDGFYIEAGDFLSADGKNGILIDNLYPGIEEGENGTTLITSVSGRYENPVYVFLLMNEGNSEAMLAFPKDSMEIGEYTFFFDPPVEYPGLRVKRSPRIIHVFLLLSVLVMTFGLAVTFLHAPEHAVIRENGYYVNEEKSEGLALRIRRVLEENQEDHHG